MARDTGEFGTEKRPVILDVSQLVRKVNWIVGNDILVLQFDYTVRFHAPLATTLNALGLVNVDPFATTINLHDTTIPAPAIVNPLSAGMNAHTLMWNKPPKKTNDESGYRWKAMNLINLRRIKTFEKLEDPNYQIRINVPAPIKNVETGVTYWIYYDRFGYGFDYEFAHPSTSGIVIDAEGHTAVVSFPTVFSGGLAKRNEILSYNEGSLPPLRTFDEPTTSERYDGFAWTIKAKTYRKRKDFPVDSNLAPQWDETKAIGSGQANATSTIGGGPAYVVTINVNLKTLAVTMTKA